MCSPKFNILISKFFYMCNNQPNTLNDLSNPRNVWGPYVPRRAPTHITKSLESHLEQLIIPKLLSGQPPKPTTKLIFQRYRINTHSTYLCLHLRSRIMVGATKPTPRHHNSNTTTEVVMEDVTPNSKRTSPNPPKSAHKRNKSNSNIISLYRNPSHMEFWYGYPIMETIAYEAGMPPISITTPIEELIASGYVASEAAELHLANMSFPGVQQKLWPTTRQHHTTTL